MSPLPRPRESVYWAGVSELVFCATNYHELSALDEQKCIILSFAVLEIQVSGVKVGVPAGPCSFLEDLGKATSSPLADPGCPPPPIAWLMTLSLAVKASGGQPSPQTASP